MFAEQNLERMERSIGATQAAIEVSLSVTKISDSARCNNFRLAELSKPVYLHVAIGSLEAHLLVRFIALPPSLLSCLGGLVDRGPAH